MMRDQDEQYWRERGVNDSLRLTKSQRRWARRVDELFDGAKAAMQKELNAWYRHVAKNEGITAAEARALLQDRNAWLLTVEKYKQLLRDFSEDAVLRAAWERHSAASAVTRIEYLQLQLQALATELYGRLNGTTRDGAIENYEDAYYRGIFAQHKWQGLATPFARLNPKAITEAVDAPVKGKNFSKRLWGDHRQELADRLNQIIGVGMATGTNKEQMAAQLMAQMDMSDGRARTLIRSEVGRARSRASLASMRENGTPRYKFIAVLDFLTSLICRSHDGHTYNVSDAIIGINYPPLHPNCRSVGTPDWPPEEGDEDETDTRFARANDSTAYKVPADMNYHEWFQKYVRGDPKELLGYTMQRNTAYDQDQYARYKAAGVLVEDSFRDFQLTKYTNVTVWDVRKQQYRALKAYQTGTLSKQIHMGKQAKHILGKGYIEGRSYLTISVEEAQGLVDRLAGTGKTSFTGAALQEIIDAGRQIGVIIDPSGGPPRETTKFKIHYSKAGVHIVPTA
jgi:SPP1 gp7 family putative phage head morphogenesis protein